MAAEKPLKPIRQSDPPPLKRNYGPRGSKYDSVIDEIKKKPGKWFVVVEDTTTTTSRVFKDKGCIVTTRGHEGSDKPNRVDVWAMWPADKPEKNEKRPARKSPVKKKTKRPVANKR